MYQLKQSHWSKPASWGSSAVSSDWDDSMHCKRTSLQLSHIMCKTRSGIFPLFVSPSGTLSEKMLLWKAAKIWHVPAAHQSRGFRVVRISAWTLLKACNCVHSEIYPPVTLSVWAVWSLWLLCLGSDCGLADIYRLRHLGQLFALITQNNICRIKVSQTGFLKFSRQTPLCPHGHASLSS